MVANKYPITQKLCHTPTQFAAARYAQNLMLLGGEPARRANAADAVAALGTTRAGKDGKPDRVTVSAKNWAVIAERLGSGRSTGALQQHWDIMNGKREKSGKKAAKAGRAAARGAEVDSGGTLRSKAPAPDGAARRSSHARRGACAPVPAMALELPTGTRRDSAPCRARSPPRRGSPLRQGCRPSRLSYLCPN